ncbi:hypothetical protein [Streptomyces flavidovirens]|uniref:hypothetical protein n=1 Tax=Streptomyces flavidovirens TaxID=67298 RepID=UPI0004914229|nr:hypothetical protein [Streptomyces flavidovirens]
MRTRRCSPAVRLGRFGAALLAVAVLTGLSTPTAVASDTPAAGQSATPEVGGEFAEIARELLDDPLGRGGMNAHRLLNMQDGNRNLAVIWFDLTGFQASHVKSLTRQFGEAPSYTDGYIGYGRLLKPEGNEALYDRMAIEGNGPLLEFAAVNDPRKDHSEAIIYEKSLTPVLSRLGMRNAAIQRLLKAGRGGFSDRGRCPACLKLTSGIPAKNFVSATPYETRQQRGASANRVFGITSKAITLLKREEKKKKAEPKQPLPAPGNPDTNCTAMGRSTGRPVLAMTAPLAADGCGEGKSAQPGGLGQALTGPAGADAYGGVDFSTLEMRYISDGSDGMRYAYSSRPLPEGYQQDTELGRRVVRTASADLRTWLVLDPQKFWVNLNPTEPDRIVDSALGRTNAGRVMLEADLQMKRTQAKILHPDSVTGKRYWRELRPSADGSSCLSSRMWITPGQVEVREDGGSLYILKAQLDVKTKSEHIDDPYSKSCDADPVTDAHNEDLERTLVLPEIVKAVNTAPEYAPLRRAFMARIIAQWVRERHQQGHRTSFDDLIDSKELGPSELDGNWRPKEVFDDYVHSYRHHEFDITRKTRDGASERITRYVYGGADLTNVQLTSVTAQEMDARYPQLDQSAQTSAGRPVTAADGSIWLGGSIRSPEEGFWEGLKDEADRLTDGNGLVLVVLLFALGATVFGFRTRPRRGNRPAA